MAVWDRGAASLPAHGTAAQARHLGRRPGLVDEDEACRIEVGLPLEPSLAARRDVRTFLFGGVRGFF
jgi:hypothetical protein